MISGIQRKRDCGNLKTKMVVKMEQGFKSHENAKQLVRNEISVQKKRIKDLKGQKQQSLQRCQHCSGKEIWNYGSITVAFPRVY